ncbi:MAG: hypothetical protein ACOC40_02540 [Thermoplasmatota archaeon]
MPIFQLKSKIIRSTRLPWGYPEARLDTSFPIEVDEDYIHLWDGETIVTVGDTSGHDLEDFVSEYPNYDQLYEATNDVAEKTLILVFPGTYDTNSKLNIDKKMIIRGVGDSYSDVQSNGDPEYMHNINTDGEALIENMHWREDHGSAWKANLIYKNNPGKTVLNKMYLSLSNSDQYGVFGDSSESELRFINTHIESGYETLKDLNLDYTYLQKCLCPSFGTHECDGSLAEDDYVESETEDYGPDYGKFFVKIDL